MFDFESISSHSLPNPNPNPILNPSSNLDLAPISPQPLPNPNPNTNPLLPPFLIICMKIEAKEARKTKKVILCTATPG